MSLFSRRNDVGDAGVFPKDIDVWLDDFGRHQFSPERFPDPWQRVGELYYQAESDRVRFLRELAAISQRDGRWVAVGAKRLVLEVLPDDLESVDFRQIVARGLSFQVENGVGAMTMRERELWSQVNSGG